MEVAAAAAARAIHSSTDFSAQPQPSLSLKIPSTTTQRILTTQSAHTINRTVDECKLPWTGLTDPAGGGGGGSGVGSGGSGGAVSATEVRGDGVQVGVSSVVVCVRRSRYVRERVCSLASEAEAASTRGPCQDGGDTRASTPLQSHGGLWFHVAVAARAGIWQRRQRRFT